MVSIDLTFIRLNSSCWVLVVCGIGTSIIISLNPVPTKDLKGPQVANLRNSTVGRVNLVNTLGEGLL